MTQVMFLFKFLTYIYFSIMADNSGSGTSSGSTIGTIGAVAAPIVGSAISSMFASGDSSKNRDFAASQADLAWQRNVDMWYAQNRYNSPKEMMQRYKDAGLNENLIYGSASGNVAQPAHAATPAAAPAAPNRPDFGAAASRSIAAYNDMRLGTAQVNNTEAQTSLAITSATKAGIEAALEMAGFPAKQKLTESQSTLALSQSGAAQSQAAKADMETMTGFDRNEREALLASTSIREAVQRIANMRIEAAALQGKTAAEIDKMKADTNLILNDSKLKSMDVNMRNNGVMPHDSMFSRSVGQMLYSIFGSKDKNADGTDKYPNPVNHLSH